MINKILLFFSILIYTNNLIGQNLVLNGGFEKVYDGNFGILKAVDWNSPTLGSPDFCHPRSIPIWGVPFNVGGMQEAKKDSGYFGLGLRSISQPEAREYIQGTLKQVLVKDSSYCFQAYISLGDTSKYALKNGVSVLFTNSMISVQTQTVLSFEPQLNVRDSSFLINKDEWMKVEGSFIATGGEKYLTIGNFKVDSLTDTLYVGAEGNEPFQRLSYYYIDDVYLGSCDSIPFDTTVGLREQNLIQRQHAIYPNPATTHFTLELEVKAQEQMVLNVYDLQGRIQVTQNLQPARLHKIEIENLSQGVYFYRIQNEKGKMLSGKLMVE